MTKKLETKGRADNIDQLVSKRLKMRRMMLGLSQHDLGKAVNVSIQQVQKYEKATNRISSGKLHAFAKFLKVPVNYFFDQSELNNNPIGTIFAEDQEKYEVESKGMVSEKEIVTLVKAFIEIKSPQVRKKFVDLMKAVNSAD
ncbi:MAG: helix-turn-helix transcriptional regulator [Rickettsiaceae bacterium]|nr:helix-turn-helix transcriptional regulator [Rickettsiaceae bacterium]